MLVAIEGIDGAGKGTQSRLLASQAMRNGWTVRSFSFPNYGHNPFAEAVGWYLNGNFGSADDVSPQLSSLLYAGDRFVVKEELAVACASYDIVIADRYVPSNLAHQAAKLPAAQRSRFFSWLESIEYGIYQIPRPQLVLYLELPVTTAMELVYKKERRKYTNLAADIHEGDGCYLSNCKDAYDELMAWDVNGKWRSISCMNARGELRPPEAISDELWNCVKEGSR